MPSPNPRPLACAITLDPITPGTIYTGEAAQKVTVRAHVTENSGQMARSTSAPCTLTTTPATRLGMRRKG